MDKKVSNITVYSMEILQPFLSDFKKGFHLRLLAKIVGTTHRTVSRALKELEKFGIVYYEINGRNKVYYLNLRNPLTKLSIMRAESYRTFGLLSNTPLISKLYGETILTLKGRSLILFGSFARGEQEKESDIDLLVIDKEDKILREQLREFGNRHGRKMHIYFIKKKEFKQGLKVRDNMILELVENHVILNNHTFFVDVLWGYYK
ncbi:MAG: nucleotidyltransferase domain-containing protein [Candidatus Aenigmarchaeota archaeon]|nr:nucleotidyltransferase domain-containing protein [Candidatus Aenigmarchaeota archaeon]